MRSGINNLVTVAAVLLWQSLAHSQSQCADLFKSQIETRAAAIESVPALAHLTTLRGIVGILKSGEIRSHNDVSGLLKNKAIGGADESVFVAPMWKPRDVRTKKVDITGPTLILSVDLLKREDYFYNLDSWENYGGFDMYTRTHKTGGSFLPSELNPQFARRMKEIMFSNPIGVKDYVVGVWIPAWLRIPFQALLLSNGIIKPKVPIYFSSTLPTTENMATLARTKRLSKLKPEHLKPHPDVPLELLPQY